MLALWIVGILAAVVIALCLVPVGVRVGLTGRGAEVDLRLAWFRIRLYPPKKTDAAEQGGGTPEKRHVKTAGKQPKPAKQRPKPAITRADVWDAVQTLWPPLKRALARTRRGIRVSPLEVRITLGGAEDPAEAALRYGRVQAAVWTGMPVLEEVLDVRDPYVGVRLDFDAPETRAEGTIGVSARIGTLLAAALGVGMPALRWLLRYQKKQKTAPPAGAAASPCGKSV